MTRSPWRGSSISTTSPARRPPGSSKRSPRPGAHIGCGVQSWSTPQSGERVTSGLRYRHLPSDERDVGAKQQDQRRHLAAGQRPAEVMLVTGEYLRKLAQVGEGV